MSTSTPLLLAADTTVLVLVALIVVSSVVVYLIYSIRKFMETSAREKTKREISAYVAEGTINATDGSKLLSAGTDEAERMIADGVAWGMVKPEKAERLIRAMRNQPESDSAPSRAQAS
jgi:hypothetical protein